MDALTAGAALILMQVCIAVVMAGVFHATPTEKCTRYWAFSGALVAFGVLLVVLNAGAPRNAILVIGNNALVIGAILQWQGIRAFHKKPPGHLGRIIAMLFFILFGLLLLRGASIAARALLSSATLLLVLCLNLSEVWTGDGPRRSFARMVTLAALGILIGDYASRTMILASGGAALLPATNSVLSAMLVYLLPMAGTLLLSTGLLLLYFERIIAEKHHLATHDELTGVLNRRAVLAGAEHAVSLAKRLRQPVSVGFVDIDYFKQINDRLGHEAGDRIIREVARALQENCRSIDLVGRYGGDEFFIVFPGASRESAAAIGERLLSAIRRSEFKDVRSVTVSLGLASSSDGADGADGGDNLAPDALIRRADEELYKAKAAGRDRLSIASEPQVTATAQSA